MRSSDGTSWDRDEAWTERINFKIAILTFQYFSVLASVSICYLDQGLSFGRNDMDLILWEVFMAGKFGRKISQYSNFEFSDVGGK